MENPLYARIDDYIDRLFGLDDEVMQAVLQSTVAAGMPQIQVSPSQGKFLYLLAKLCSTRRILEIGSLAGYSTIWLGRALPADGRLISLELLPSHAEVTRANLERAGLNHVAEVRVGAATASLAQLVDAAEAPFDLVFIDADKVSYPVYLEWSLRLTRPGSLIVADNIIREGKVIAPAAADEATQGASRFNAALAADPRVEAVLLQMIGGKGHDGLAIARVV